MRRALTTAGLYLWRPIRTSTHVVGILVALVGLAQVIYVLLKIGDAKAEAKVDAGDWASFIDLAITPAWGLYLSGLAAGSLLVASILARRGNR